MFSLSDRSKLRYACVFGIISIFIGTYLQVGPLFPFRVFILAILPFVLINIEILNYSKFNILFVAMLIYSIASLFWVPNIFLGIRYVSLYVVNILMILFFMVFYKKTKLYSTLIDTISYCTLLLILVGTWEVLTFNHLVETSEKYNQVVAKFTPRAFYSNPNSLATYLVMFVPILNYKISIWQNRSFLLKVITITTLNILVIIISIYAMSRGALLAIGVQYIVYLFFYLKNNLKLLPICLILFLGLTYISPLSQDFSIKEKVDIATQGSESNSVRFNMLWITFNMAKDTYGLGLGAGGVEDKMVEYANKEGLNINQIRSPHNFFGEVLANYGLVGLLAHIIFFISITIHILKRINYVNLKYQRLYLAILAILLSFPVFSSISSSAYQDRFTWFLIGFIVITLKHISNTNNIVKIKNL